MNTDLLPKDFGVYHCDVADRFLHDHSLSDEQTITEASISRCVQVGQASVINIGTLGERSLEQYFNNFGIVVDIQILAGTSKVTGSNCKEAVVTFTDKTGLLVV